jgi:hypothetical protein
MHRTHRSRLAHQEDLVHPNGKDLARDICGLIAHQIAGHRRDLGGRHLLDLLDPRLLFRRVGLDRGNHPAPGEGRDAVGPHVPAFEVERDGSRKGRNAQFGRRIVHLGVIANQARGRGHVHQRAAFLLAEIISRGARGIEGAVEVYFHHRIEVLVAHLVKEAVAQDSGIVHDCVDAAEFLHGGLDHGPGRVRVGYAAAIGDGVATGGLDLVHHRLRSSESVASTLQ